MSADILLSLKKNKFLRDFERVDRKCGEFPLRSHFKEIVDMLNEMTISSSTPLDMKNLLHDLGNALANCEMLSEERKLRAQNKEISPPSRLAKEFLFVTKTQGQLRRFKEQLSNIKKTTNGAEAAKAVEEAETSSSSNLPTVRATARFQFLDEFKIYGFQRHVEEIESKLLEERRNDKSAKAIGIVGMGGSGKSTLAKRIFCESTIQQHFDPMIWVWLSERLDPENISSRKNIVRAMLECLNSGPGSSDDLDELLQSLQNQLSGKKYLLVLDNVFRASDWYSDLQTEIEGDNSRLSRRLPKGTGGAIIVTSTLQDVATKMVGKQNLYPLLPELDRDSCWSIFTDTINKKRFISPEPMATRMKEEILDKCSGLPLAAKALAEIIAFQMLTVEYEALELFWSDPSNKKIYYLELDLYDEHDKEKAMATAKTLRGIEDVRPRHSSNARIFAVKGSRHPIEITKELGKVWPTELLRVSMPLS